LALIKGIHKNFHAYDKEGLVWIVSKVDSNYNVNVLTKLLAYTIYPQIKVALTWKKTGEYKLDNLKKIFFSRPTEMMIF
jgi:hypothetical protein